MSGAESLRDELAREAKDWRHNAYTRVMLAQMHDRLSTTPSQGLDAATVERCAQVADEYADGCKIAARDEDLTGESLAYTRGCLTGAMAVATRIRALANEPHQHGGKGA